MLATYQQGAIKKFHRTPWRFQRTFHTPLQNLDSFTATILSSLDYVDSATMTVDSVIIEPKNLTALLSSHQLQHSLRHDTSIVAEISTEAQPLLTAALGDWVDFLFIPTPKPFVLYADHDEYTTFYANSKANLNRVTAALTKGGFTAVENYIRNA
jgi:hypothetical protein